MHMHSGKDTHIQAQTHIDLPCIHICSQAEIHNMHVRTHSPLATHTYTVMSVMSGHLPFLLEGYPQTSHRGLVTGYWLLLGSLW